MASCQPWLRIKGLFESVPTAHSFAAPGRVAAPDSGLNVPAVGSVSTDQALPFQRRIMPWTTPPLMLGRLLPTAYTSLGPRAATPVNPGSAPGVGLAATLQLPPFQCSINVLPPTAEVAPMSSPTAQALVAETAVTAEIVGVFVPGCCIGTALHAVPLKCSASAIVAEVAVSKDVPTIQMSVAEVAEIDSPDPGLKLASGTGTVAVLGREIDARVAALRKVDFAGFGANFPIVLDPAALAGADFARPMQGEPQAKSEEEETDAPRGKKPFKPAGKNGLIADRKGRRVLVQRTGSDEARARNEAEAAGYGPPRRPQRGYHGKRDLKPRDE